MRTRKTPKDKVPAYTMKLSDDEKDFAQKIVNTINAQVVSLRNEIGQLEGQLIQNIALYGPEHSAIISITITFKLFTRTYI